MISIRTRLMVPLLCMASCVSMHMGASILSPSEKFEVQHRWQSIFLRQLDAIEQDLNFVANDQERNDIVWLLQRCAVLADRMVSFDEQDEHEALQLMTQHEDGLLWQRFVARKDTESIQAYIDELMQSLCGYIGSGCVLRFPPQLFDFDEQIVTTGLEEQAFMIRVRQAFLAFTFIVSKMNMIMRTQDII
jgi:hypothetical protein